MEDIMEHSYDDASEINNVWSDINLAVVHLGSLIRERWLRMRGSQCKAVLLGAWPELSSNHRPDMDKCLLKACPHERCSEALASMPFLI